MLGNVEFGLNTRIHPVNRLSPFQLVFNRIPNAFLTKLSIKIPPHFSIASFLDNALHQLKAWNCISSARDSHYASQCQKLDDKHRISEPLPVGSIVFYSKTPKELKFSPWVGPYVVIGHDEFKNHVIRAISFGLSVSEQLDPGRVAHTLTLPLDHLKPTPQFNLSEYEHWVTKDTIVSHSYVGKDLYYRVRYACFSPLFDQLIPEHDVKDTSMVKDYWARLN